MKTLTFLIPGALGLCLSALPMQAQASPLLLAAQPKSGPVAKILMSPEQKAQAQQIRQRSVRQINGLLRPEQKAQYKAARQKGQTQRQALQGLALDRDQTRQIKQIMQAARQDLQKLLTPEQRQQIRQNQGKNIPTA
jgi:periplasmic protein CpxP/Spy